MSISLVKRNSEKGNNPAKYNCCNHIKINLYDKNIRNVNAIYTFKAVEAMINWETIS